MAPQRKQVIQETLGKFVLDSLGDAAVGEAAVQAVDRFVFADIDDETTAMDLFSFIEDTETQILLALTYRGVRWQQKTGLVFARRVAHPAHAAQVRSQLIEYGGIVETCLRAVIEQAGKKPPGTFATLITRCEGLKVLSASGSDAANRLRESRNCVHLFLTLGKRPPGAQREARKAWQDFTLVINELRSDSGLSIWHFGAAPV